MMKRKVFHNLYIFIAVVIIILIDVELASFLRQKFNPHFLMILFTDVIIITVAGFLGKLFPVKWVSLYGGIKTANCLFQDNREF